MKLRTKLTTAAISALVLGGAIAGTAATAGSAVAQPTKVHAVVSQPTGPDTDAIQQGDQTGADTSSAAASEATSPDTDAIQQGDQTGADSTAAVTAAKITVNGETPGESSGENQPSDGPGGHADPAGDVQHEFSGVE